MTEAEWEARKSALFITVLKQACPDRYSEIARELQNDILKAVDHCLTNVTAAYMVLTNWQLGARTRRMAPLLDGVVYPMSGQIGEHGADGSTTLATTGRRRDLSYVRYIQRKVQ